MLEFNAALSTAMEVAKNRNAPQTNLPRRNRTGRFRPSCWAKCSAIGTPPIIFA